MGLTIVIIGAILLIASFAFAVINMGKGIGDIFNSNQDPMAGFGSTFRRHLGAMVGFFCGLVLTGIGILVLILERT